MKRHAFRLAIILLAGLLTSQCTRNSGNPVGADYFDRSNSGLIMPPVTLSGQDTAYSLEASASSSPYLFAGTAGDVSARSLIRYGQLPDSGTVDSALFVFHIDGFPGDEPAGLMPEIHRIDQSWTAASVTWNDVETAGFTGEQIIPESWYVQGDSLVFRLPLAVIQSWIDSTTAGENYGFLLTYPQGMEGMVRFLSRDEASSTGFPPYMNLTVTDALGQESYTYVPESDVYVANTEWEPALDRLAVSGTLAWRSLFHFPLDTIPQDATINRALLRLYADTTQSFPDHASDFEIIGYPATEYPWPVPSVPYDSTFTISALLTGDSAVINLTSLVQTWTAGMLANDGLILKSLFENYNLNRRVFYSAESERPPTLEITYSLPPSPAEGE